MARNYASLNSNTTLGFNKKLHKKSASGLGYKSMKLTWFFMFLGFSLVSITQKATASNTTKAVAVPSYIFYTIILPSSIAQGQSGGGGHGDPIWLLRDGLYPKPIDVLSTKLLITITLI
jgi:hypothetical protein